MHWERTTGLIIAEQMQCIEASLGAETTMRRILTRPNTRVSIGRGCVADGFKGRRCDRWRRAFPRVPPRDPASTRNTRGTTCRVDLSCGGRCIRYVDTYPSKTEPPWPAPALLAGFVT
ncbi:hypothetical protein BHM03_00018764 [Ensete ventricosum]|nr:hypothetical protein BHM03_00018764 [Ensete ventricosum]